MRPGTTVLLGAFTLIFRLINKRTSIAVGGVGCRFRREPLLRLNAQGAPVGAAPPPRPSQDRSRSSCHRERQKGGPLERYLRPDAV